VPLRHNAKHYSGSGEEGKENLSYLPLRKGEKPGRATPGVTPTTTPTIAGIGATGLSIVRGTAEIYRGRVEVESAPGKGSTLRVILPLKHKT